jgi:hypothetical protein
MNMRTRPLLVAGALLVLGTTTSNALIRAKGSPAFVTGPTQGSPWKIGRHRALGAAAVRPANAPRVARPQVLELRAQQQPGMGRDRDDAETNIPIDLELVRRQLEVFAKIAKVKSQQP